MISKKMLKSYFISIFMVLLICFIYQYYISPIFDGHINSFGEYGYRIGIFNIDNFIISMFFLLIINFLLPTKIINPSDFIMILYYYVVMIPYLSLYSLDLFSGLSLFISLLAFFILYTLYAIFFQNNTMYYNIESCYNMKALYIIVGSAVFLILILILKFGISSSIDSILNVYSQRMLFNNSGILYQLIFYLLAFGFIPYLIYEYAKRNSLNILFIIIFFTIILFLYTGSKMVFMGTLISIILIKIMKNNQINSYTIGILINIIFIFSILLANIFNSYLVLSLFIRRTFILVAQIYGLYFEYFTVKPYNYMAKYLSFLFGWQNTKSASHVIGSTYFLDNTHANSGIISDAYANFGILGIIVYIVILFVIFKIINKLNIMYNYYLTPLIFLIAISLTNSGVIAVFIYQLLPFMIVFYLMRGKE